MIRRKATDISQKVIASEVGAIVVTIVLSVIQGEFNLEAFAAGQIAAAAAYLKTDRAPAR